MRQRKSKLLVFTCPHNLFTVKLKALSNIAKGSIKGTASGFAHMITRPTHVGRIFLCFVKKVSKQVKIVKGETN